MTLRAICRALTMEDKRTHKYCLLQEIGDHSLTITDGSITIHLVRKPGKRAFKEIKHNHRSLPLPSVR